MVLLGQQTCYPLAVVLVLRLVLVTVQVLVLIGFMLVPLASASGRASACPRPLRRV